MKQFEQILFFDKISQWDIIFKLCFRTFKCMLKSSKS